MAGPVLRQTPPSGKIAPKGAEVSLLIVISADRVVVPGVHKMTLAEAGAARKDQSQSDDRRIKGACHRPPGLVNQNEAEAVAALTAAGLIRWSTPKWPLASFRIFPSPHHGLPGIGLAHPIQPAADAHRCCSRNTPNSCTD